MAGGGKKGKMYTPILPPPPRVEKKSAVKSKGKYIIEGRRQHKAKDSGLV